MRLNSMQIALLGLLCIAMHSNSLLIPSIFTGKDSGDSTCPPNYIKPLANYSVKELLGNWWNIKCLPGVFCDNLYCLTGNYEWSGDTLTLSFLAYNKSIEDIYEHRSNITVQNNVLVAPGSNGGPQLKYIPLLIKKSWGIIAGCIPNHKGKIILQVWVVSRTPEFPKSEEHELMKNLNNNGLGNMDMLACKSQLCSLLGDYKMEEEFTAKPKY